MGCGGGMQGFGREMFYSFFGCAPTIRSIGRTMLRVVFGGGGGMMMETSDIYEISKETGLTESELAGKG